jgi:hypothetical protein
VGDGVGFGVGGNTPGIPVNEGTGLGTSGTGITGIIAVVALRALPPPHAAIAADAASATMAERYLIRARYAQHVKYL